MYQMLKMMLNHPQINPLEFIGINIRDRNMNSPVRRLFMSASRCAPFLIALLLPHLLPAQSERPNTEEDATTLTVGMAMVFWGGNEALVWSEETGYFEIRQKDKFEGPAARSMVTNMIKIKGHWVKPGLFELDSFEPLRTEPRSIPPAESITPWLADELSPVTCEGVVLHCIDRVFLMELVVGVEGRRVGVIFQGASKQLRKRIYPGQRIQITGHLWSHPPYPAPIPNIICCMKDGVEPLWRDPWPGINQGREYTNMVYMGITSDGEYMFTASDKSISIHMQLNAYRLLDWGLRKDRNFKLKIKDHPAPVNGTIQGHSISVVDTGWETMQFPTMDLSLSEPQVGFNVRFTGSLAQSDLQKNGDMWLVLEDDNGRGQAKAICKRFKKQWPGLELSQNAFVEVTGLCQNIDTASGSAEIVVEKRGDLYLPKTGRNWSPILWSMVAILFLGVLWVAMLRRLVRIRTREAGKSEAKLMAIYQSVPLGIVAVDRQQRIFGKNQALANMFGIPQTADRAPFAELCEAIGERMLQPESWRHFLSAECPPGKQEFTIRDAAAPGKTRSVEILVTPIIDKREEGEIWLFRDLTEQRELESTLAQARKLEAVGRLTGGIAHDFNNLLTGVSGNLSMLDLEIRENTPSNELLEYVQGASTAADHAAQLVRQLLEYSKRTRLNLTNASANNILTDLYDIIRHSVDARIDLKFQLASDLLTTQVDTVKIERVLMNLVVNAMDALQDGGTVEVHTANAHLPNGREAVAITVSDNGCGIPPDAIDKIFEPYFTTKAEKGNGLGLSSALAIVEQHGGKLFCRSSVGQGTTFEVLLPANHAPIQSPPPAKAYPGPAIPEPHTSASHPSVVAIDDHPEVLELVDNMLSRLGYTVSCFPNGEEALKHIHAMDGEIDLIISDNAMPVMNGVETYEAVRAAYPNIPFIVCSGYLVDLDEYGQRANGTLPEAFLPKPLQINKFTDVVSHVLPVE